MCSINHAYIFRYRGINVQFTADWLHLPPLHFEDIIRVVLPPR